MNITCGECNYYEVDTNELTQGLCVANPPKLFLIPKGKEIVMQGFTPNVPHSRPACRFFQAKQSQ